MLFLQIEDARLFLGGVKVYLYVGSMQLSSTLHVFSVLWALSYIYVLYYDVLARSALCQPYERTCFAQ